MRDEDKTKDQLIAELRALREGFGASAVPGDVELREACGLAIFDHMPLMILLFGGGGRVRLANRHWERTLGWSQEEASGRDVFADCFPDASREAREHLLEATGAWRELKATARDGRLLDTSWTAVRTPAGDTICIGHEITERNRTEERLRRNESLLAEAQRLAQIGSWNLDLATGGLAWSDEHYRIFGLDPAERPVELSRAIGFVHPDDRDSLDSAVRQAMRDRRPYECCVRFVQSRGQGVFGEAGLPVRLFGTTQDITDRVLADQALEDSKGRFRAVFENALDGILLMDDAGRYVDANPAICRLLGYDRDTLLGMTVWDVTPHLDRARIPELMGLFLAAGTMSGEYTLLGNGGAMREVEYCSVANIRPGLHLGIHRDIAERKLAEQALARNATRLQALSRRLVEVQEAERRHLARELHDEVGQLLTGLRLLLKDGEGLPAGSAARLEQARGIIDGLLGRIRGLSFDLLPAELDQLGLLPALLALFARYTARTGVRVDFKHDGLGARFAPDVETAAYRIVQEALTNVARHAGVAEAATRILADAESLRVQVEDQGAGFDPEHLRSGGLMGLRERAALLGGRLAVESAPGEGTHLFAELPLRAKGGGP